MPSKTQLAVGKLTNHLKGEPSEALRMYSLIGEYLHFSELFKCIIIKELYLPLRKHPSSTLSDHFIKSILYFRRDLDESCSTYEKYTSDNTMSKL